MDQAPGREHQQAQPAHGLQLSPAFRAIEIPSSMSSPGPNAIPSAPAAPAGLPHFHEFGAASGQVS